MCDTVLKKSQKQTKHHSEFQPCLLLGLILFLFSFHRIKKTQKSSFCESCLATAESLTFIHHLNHSSVPQFFPQFPQSMEGSRFNKLLVNPIHVFTNSISRKRHKALFSNSCSFCQTSYVTLGC